MFDYKQLFGFAAILFGIGFILQSIMPAGANPAAPSISLGANPIFSVYTSGQSGALFINNTSSPAIITDLVVVAYYDCQMNFSVSNGGDTFAIRADPDLATSGFISLNSGIKVPAGETLSYSGASNYCQGASASGYYAH